MTGNREASRSGPEHLARQHHPRPAGQRDAATLHRRALGDRAHVQPDDLRPRHQEQRHLRRRRSAAKVRAGRSGEDLFFDLALEDLTRAADLFRPIFERTDGVDGWVSLEVSPLLAHDTASTLAAAKALHDRAGRPNLFIKIPGTPEGLPAIEEAIFAGVPVNVTLLFSREQYVAAAEAYLRGIERRIAAGLNPAVGSVASVFISRWDVAVAGKVPAGADQPSGHRHRPAHLQGLPRSARLGRAGSGPRMPAPAPQRLLWASTGTKDPKAVRHPLRQGACRAVHRQHHARGHAEGVRRSRRGRRRHGGRRRRRRGGAGELRQGGHRCRRAGRPVAGRGGEILRRILERSDVLHRVQKSADVRQAG